MQWTVKLWARDPGKRYAILAAACMAGLLGWMVFAQPLMALVGFGAILAGTTDFWLPQRYTLDGNGAHMRCGISVTSIQWSAVKRAIHTSHGLQLSPLEKTGRMDSFRGVYLRYAENREEVLETVKRLWGKDV
jgi:hypothetical protein